MEHHHIEVKLKPTLNNSTNKEELTIKEDGNCKLCISLHTGQNLILRKGSGSEASSTLSITVNKLTRTNYITSGNSSSTPNSKLISLTNIPSLYGGDVYLLDV